MAVVSNFFFWLVDLEKSSLEWPCFLSNQDEIIKSYREPSIDALFGQAVSEINQPKTRTYIMTLVL
jgi:hypothetical protein